MHWAYFRASWVTLFDAPDELDPPDDAVVVVGSELDGPPLHAATPNPRAMTAVSPAVHRQRRLPLLISRPTVGAVSLAFTSSLALKSLPFVS
jgi:hypothetical protein